MDDELVKLEVAKLASEVGFDWDCENVFKEDDGSDKLMYFEFGGSINNSSIDKNFYTSNNIVCTQPSLSLLQKWLREIHNFHIIIDPVFKESPCRGEEMIIDYYGVRARSNKMYAGSEIGGIGVTYEGCLESMLQAVLEYIKQMPNEALKNAKKNYDKFRNNTPTEPQGGNEGEEHY